MDDGSTGRIWAERVIPDPGTDVKARFTDGHAAGGPAVLRRGTVRYLATRPDAAILSRLLPAWAAQAGCAPPIHGAGRGVEVVRRTAADGRSWVFVINHTGGAAAVTREAGPATAVAAGASRQLTG